MKPPDEGEKKAPGKAFPVIALSLVLIAGLAGPLRGDEKPKRGDYPRCQEECLSQLRSRMAALSEEYKRTENKLLYEQEVERARYHYDDCIDRCRIRYSVK
ncbi:MAG TPA: hypothetical protein VHN82_03810 [Methanoregula sp.]|nr:hypothetical protein [Methanoregula sp.]